jgi:hypothetical protein
MSKDRISEGDQKQQHTIMINLLTAHLPIFTIGFHPIPLLSSCL